MKNYEVNVETLAILPHGENKSKVIEKNGSIIVDKSPIKIIDDSCKFFGSSYDGRFNGTKSMLGISHKAPIIIEESKKIIFFPTASPRLESCSWIALNNVDTYFKSNGDTVIKFSCGKDLRLELSYGIVDNQVLRATRLELILEKRLEKV